MTHDPHGRTRPQPHAINARTARVLAPSKLTDLVRTQTTGGKLNGGASKA
jgi:hypothetical protein